MTSNYNINISVNDEKVGNSIRDKIVAILQEEKAATPDASISVTASNNWQFQPEVKKG